MKNRFKNAFKWLMPLLGIAFLALITLKRVPEPKDDKNYKETKAYSPIFDADDFDETLLLYDEIDGIDLELNNLHALTLDAEDNIYVSGDNSLLILNPDGSEFKKIKLSAPGRSLSVAGDGDIYVGFINNIKIYDSEGKKKSVWKKIDDDSVVTSMAVVGNFLFVADAGTRHVWKFNLNGKLLGKIGDENKKEGIPKFIVPSPYFDLAVAGDDTIWVVNPGRHKLEHFTLDGTLIGMWGVASSEMEGFCGCCNPTHIALLDDGSFVTSEKGYPRVKIYDSTGEFSGIVAAGSQFAEKTKGLDLAVDSKNRIYLLDPKMKKIRIFIRK